MDPGENATECQCDKFQLLVKVRGDTLELNPDAMTSLKGTSEETVSVPMVVVSVVGQPKSQKTSVLNTLLHYSSCDYSFPPGACHNNCKNVHLHSEDGILIPKSPLVRSDKTGKKTLWIFMDVWMQNPRQAVYKKLIDFSLSVSSVVVYSEHYCDETKIAPYWSPQVSSLSHQSTIHQKFQLHFALQGFAGVQSGFREKSPVSLESCSGIPQLESVKEISQYLSNRSQLVTTTILPSSGENTLPNTWCEPLEAILAQGAQSPLRICKEIVTLQNVNLWFQINIHTILAGEQQNDPWTFAASTPEGPMATKVEGIIWERVENDILHKVKAAPSIASLEPPFESYYTKLYKELSERNPPGFHLSIHNELLNVRNQTQGILTRMKSLLKLYNENLTKDVQDQICLDPEEFEKSHERALEAAKTLINYEQGSPRAQLNQALYLIIEAIKSNTSLKNGQFYTKEQALAQEAAQHALEIYNKYMGNKIQRMSPSQSELLSMHQYASSLVTDSFLKRTGESKPSPPWIKQLEILKRGLESAFENCQTAKLNVRSEPVVGHKEEIQRKNSQDKRQYYGIGIYVAPQKVLAGIYLGQKSNFRENVLHYDEPYIAFAPDQVLVGKDAKAHHYKDKHNPCFNVFDLLQPNNNVELNTYLEGQQILLKNEDMLSIFFHRVRMEIEERLKEKIDSCYVTTATVISSGAKQILKSSLEIAGFTKNVLIPTTTAMACSYILKHELPASPAHHPILLGYVSSNLVEFSSVTPTKSSTKVHAVTGSTNIHLYKKLSGKCIQTEQLENKVTSMVEYIASKTPNEPQYARVLYAFDEDIDESLIQVVGNTLAASYQMTTFSVVNDILWAAASFHANRRNHPDFHQRIIKFPSFNYVSPFTIEVRTRSSSLLIRPNETTPVQKKVPFLESPDEDKTLTISEIVLNGEDNKTCDRSEYTFLIKGSLNSCVVNLSKEGNFSVGVANSTASSNKWAIYTKNKLLIHGGFKKVMENVSPVLNFQQSRFTVR